MEQFETFGEPLLPIMNGLGGDPAEPQVAVVHTCQNGEATTDSSQAAMLMVGTGPVEPTCVIREW